LSLARPASEESAFKDLRGLRRRGRRLLVSAGLVALAFFFTIIIVSYGSERNQSLMLIIGDYIVTLGIAVPGLTLYVLRLYTSRSIRRGNAKVFSRNVKVALISIDWVVLVIIVILLIKQSGM
jgi:hypothetical protein